MKQLRGWFDGSDAVAIASAFLTVGVSIWLFIRQGRLHRETLGLQRRVTHIEEERRAEEIAHSMQADLWVELRGPKPPFEAHTLVVTNIGAATARDVDVDSLISRRTGKSPVQMNPPYPVASIHPGDSITSYIYPTWGADAPLEVAVGWTDPRGQQTKTQTLTPASP